jgi:hypothetical protein
MKSVYLESLTRATFQGGPGQNYYYTFQTAYNAAVNLQQGTEEVIIFVGYTTAEEVGNLVLTADWNYYISLQGINKSVSAVGNITATSTTGRSFNIGTYNNGSDYGFINMQNLTIGNIDGRFLGTVTSTANSSSYIHIQVFNTVIGNIDNSINDSAALGTVGDIRINARLNQQVQCTSPNSYIGNTVSNSTNATGPDNIETYPNMIEYEGIDGIGTVTTTFGNTYIVYSGTVKGITAPYVTLHGVSLQGGVSCAAFSATKVDTGQTINIVETAAVNGSFNRFDDSQLQTVNFTRYSTDAVVITASRTSFSTFTYTDTNVGSAVVTNINFGNCAFTTLVQNITTFGNCVMSLSDTRYSSLTLNKGIVKIITSTNETIIMRNINAAYSIAFASQRVINSILIKNNTGSAITGGIKFGVSSGAADIGTQATVNGSSLNLITESGLTNRSGNGTVFIDAVTSWNGSNATIHIVASRTPVT